MPLPDDVDIFIDPERARGVWTNASRAVALADEVTIDFVRVDPFEPEGTVVARIACSPRFFPELLDELESVWHDWVWRLQPGEEPP